MHIVTGGAGFIGSALIWRLNREGVDDILCVDALGENDAWKNLRALSIADYLDHAEFAERLAADDLPEDVEAVFHLGACSATTERDAGYLMENNYAFSRDLALWALDRDARLVHASSAATYGDGSAGYDDDEEKLGLLRPLNAYGFSKHLFDRWAKAEGALDRIASVKFFNVYGPNEYHKGEMASLVYKAHGQIARTGRMALFRSHRSDYADGGQTRDFLYVKDAVDVLWWLAEHPGANGIFNVGTGRARTWNDLARALFAAMGREPAIDYVDMPEGLRGQYQYHTEAVVDKLRAAGYDRAFTPLEDGVRDYVTGYLDAPDPYLAP